MVQVDKYNFCSARNNPLLDLTTPDVQYMRWSPSGSHLVWVRENDIYYAESPSFDIQRITMDGRQNIIYNGVPDWVYEGRYKLVRGWGAKVDL